MGSFTNITDIFSGGAAVCVIIYLIIQGIRYGITLKRESKLLIDEGHTKRSKREAIAKAKRQQEIIEVIETTIIPKLDNINDNIKKLSNSECDLLRREINIIYFRYLPYKKIPKEEKQQLISLFKDYQNLGGNSYVHDIYNTIMSWEVVQDYSDLKIDLRL